MRELVNQTQNHVHLAILVTLPVVPDVFGEFKITITGTVKELVFPQGPPAVAIARGAEGIELSVETNARYHRRLKGIGVVKENVKV